MRSLARGFTGTLTVVLGLVVVFFFVSPQAASAVSGGQAGPVGASPSLEIAMGHSAFAPISTQSLFSDKTYLVPGATRSATFWVRNASPDASLLTLALADVTGSSSLLLKSMTIDAVIPGSRGSAVNFHKASHQSCQILVQDQPVAAGGILRVTISLSLMPGVSGSEAQNASASFHLVAGLRDAASGISSSKCSLTSSAPNLSPTTLAYTGSNVLPSLALGALILGGGLVILLLSRRRRVGHTGENTERMTDDG